MLTKPEAFNSISQGFLQQSSKTRPLLTTVCRLGTTGNATELMQIGELDTSLL